MARKATLQVVPKNANVGSLGLQYEDSLSVEIEHARPITKAEAKELARLYEGWMTRVEKASRKIAKADGEELLPIRFDSFAVTAGRARGGAARFLDATEACKWLVAELTKRPNVVRVVFGEEDVPASPKKSTATRSESAAAKKVDAAVRKIFGGEASSARVLGRIAIRFTGETLASTKVVRDLLEEAIGLAGDVGSIWARGTWNKRGSLDEVNQGRDVHDKAGRALLDRIFSDVRKMPRSDADPAILDLVLSDGPRPEHKSGMWKTGCRVPASFGAKVRLAPFDDRPPGGLLEIWTPLADLDDPARRDVWGAFGARAFAALAGSVGSFSPALWMEEIAPDDVPLALLTELPAVALSQIVGHHAGGFNYPDFAPDVHHGLFDPSWVTWIASDVARAVRSFPGKRRMIPGGVELRVEDAAPVAMNDASYARYRDAWKALDAIRIRWDGSDDDDREPWRHALDRFDAPNLKKLGAFLEKRLADGQERSKLYWSSRHAADQGQGKKAYTEAERAIALGCTGAVIYETLLHGALSFRGQGKIDVAAARKALGRVEKLPSAEQANLALATAKVLLALTPDDPKKALASLGAHTRPEPRPDRSAFDPAFAPIADDDRFRRVAGWATKSEIAKLRGTPRLDNAFPKLAKAIKAKPELAAFGSPASTKAIASAERALGMKLPPRYRTMLATFDGATFRDGRETLYAAADLPAKNAKRETGSDAELAIGWNLVLYPAGIKNGEASISEPFHGVRSEGTTFDWNTLDACLADLARGKK